MAHITGGLPLKPHNLSPFGNPCQNEKLAAKVLLL